MNVNQLIQELSSLKSDLREKEVVVVAKNGSLFTPAIKFEKKDSAKLDLTKENVNRVILSY